MASSESKHPDMALGLHRCPSCDSGLVQPVSWQQAGGSGCWRVWRRCPECEWRADAIHEEHEIEAYDEHLDRGAHVLAEELRQLQRRNMAEMADALVAGLWADLIGADDFAPAREARPTR